MNKRQPEVRIIAETSRETYEGSSLKSLAEQIMEFNLNYEVPFIKELYQVNEYGDKTNLDIKYLYELEELLVEIANEIIEEENYQHGLRNHQF